MISIGKSGLAVALAALAVPATAAQERAQMSCQSPSHEAVDAMHQLREIMLVPGTRIDFARIMANPVLLAQREAEQERRSSDWAYLCRYKAENAQTRRSDVVFIGDSITENWIQADPSLFSGVTLDRGIGGQTSSQILLRFYQDVVALRPRIVHLMAGTNDVAGNTGAIADDNIVYNISAMIDIASANGIKVVLASIPPASTLPWQPALRPAARIVALNARLHQLAIQRGVIFVNYYSLLANNHGGLRADLGNDGVHPNRRGYALMRPMAERAIARAAAATAKSATGAPDR